MSKAEDWLTSVGELIEIFRDSLVALVPIMERARLPWRDEAAYDQWDAISETLFDRLVVDTIRWALEDFHMTMPRYGFLLPDYSNLSLIKVSSPALGATSISIFLNFATQEKPFDTLRVVPLDSTWQPLPHAERDLLRLESVRFELLHVDEDGSRESIQELTIPS